MPINNGCCNSGYDALTFYVQEQRLFKGFLETGLVILSSSLAAAAIEIGVSFIMMELG